MNNICADKYVLFFESGENDIGKIIKARLSSDQIEKKYIFMTGDMLRDYAYDVSELFWLYEFADDFMYFCKKASFPSLINLVRSGLITEDEMIEAILYDKNQVLNEREPL